MLDSNNNKITILMNTDLGIARKNCKIMLENNILFEIVKIVSEDLKNLEDAIKNAGSDLENLNLLENEHNLRISSSILALLSVQCENDPILIKDLIDPKNKIEDLCLKSFKMSLDMTIMPIKKFLFIYCIYLQGVFGGPPKNSQEKIKNITKDLYANEFKKKVEKMKIPNNSAAEEFYRRHVSKENVIPQVFIVSLLRILLTTCPNASKSSGGIDIHREWNSLLLWQKKFEKYKDLKLAPPEEQKKPEEDKKSGSAKKDTDWRKAIIEDLNKDPAEHNKANSEAVCEIPEFQTEYNRHRFIIGYTITRIYTWILGHLKSNCIFWS